MWINFAQFYIFQNINEFIHRFGTFRHNRPITLSHKQKNPRNCRKRNSTFNYFFNILIISCSKSIKVSLKIEIKAITITRCLILRFK